MGRLRKMVWVHRKIWEVVGSDHTGQVGCLMGEVRGWERVGGRLVRGKVGVNNPSVVFGYCGFRCGDIVHWVGRTTSTGIIVVHKLGDVRNIRR